MALRCLCFFLRPELPLIFADNGGERLGVDGFLGVSEEGCLGDKVNGCRAPWGALGTH
jgi:hypothetical protein